MAKTKRTSADVRREQLRLSFFPDVQKEDLWTSDLNGWCWVPRTMPLLLQAIRDLSKGAAAADTYFALWCHSISEAIVEMKDRASLIAAAGYTGASGERTWKERMKKLEELGFIRIAPGIHGDISCVLLLNPHKVLKGLKESGKSEIGTALYNKIVETMTNYGCRDFRQPQPQQPPLPVAPQPKK